MRLFAESFLVEPEEIPVPASVFDDERGYAVDGEGRPSVEAASAEHTHTVTEVRGEQTDSDPAPEPRTLTFVEAEGTDFSLLELTATATRVQAEAPDSDQAAMGVPGESTTTKVRAEARDVTSLWLESVPHRQIQATMTKTAVDYPSDRDSDS
jgi:hypothetical protein